MVANVKIELTSNAFRERTESQAIGEVQKFMENNPKPVQAKMELGLFKEVFLITIGEEHCGVITIYSDISEKHKLL